jgi:hypothetical protein
MRPQTYNSASRTANFPRPLIDPRQRSSPRSGGVPLRCLMALAMALLLVPIVQGDGFAQQTPDQPSQDQPSQDQPSQDKPSAGQPSGDQQPSYAQPNVAQPNSAQPDSAQPNYAQPQADGQQSYPQQPYQGSSQTDPQQSSGQIQPLNAQDLEQLVAPIALYPDALVAQVLAASTYPAQVTDADRWRRAQGYASSDQIAAGADAQPWDPSVKALTAFPQVLAQMDQNLHWTSELGNAYYNQPQDVLQAVQVMRRRARAAGNLQSTPQEAVNVAQGNDQNYDQGSAQNYDQGNDQNYAPGNILIEPVNPQVVYVPVYNPWVVYGLPVSPYPGFSLLGAVGSFIGSSFGPVRFGLGIAMTAFTRTPFGLLAWGLNWLTQSVVFHGSNYYSHSATLADWGLPRGGPRAFSQRGAMARPSNRSYRANGGYGRASGGYGGEYSGRPAVRTPDRTYDRTRDHDQGAYARNRPAESYSRGYPTSGASYGRSSPEAYNRFQPPVDRSVQNRSAQNRSQDYRSQNYRSPDYRSPDYRTQPGRSQAYGNPGYGSSSYGRPAESYRGRAGASYGSSMRANPAPGASFQRGDFGKRYSGGFNGKGFAESSGKRAHSGGFHFGGGRAPKAPRAEKSFSRAHSGGGGHFGGHGHSGGRHRG